MMLFRNFTDATRSDISRVNVATECVIRFPWGDHLLVSLKRRKKEAQVLHRYVERILKCKGSPSLEEDLNSENDVNSQIIFGRGRGTAD